MGYDPEDIVELAAEVGRVVLGVYQKERVEVHQKDDRSPVTEADMLAHEQILTGLRRLAPELPIVSEESWKDGSKLPRNSEYWLVDPVDGTLDFIKKTDDFTVNIAHMASGKPIFGVVVAPAHHTVFWGGAETGSFIRDREGTRKMSIRSFNPDRPACLVSRHFAGREAEVTAEWWPKRELVPAGSSLKLCWIGAGRADAYLRLKPTKAWDIAAGQAVLESSGGTIITTKGEGLHYDRDEILNPPFLAFGDPQIDGLALVKDL